MAKASGEVYTAGRFEWILPYLLADLPDVGSVWESPRYSCCGAEFGLVLTRRGHPVHIQLIRHVGTVAHRNDAICEFIKIDGGGREHEFREPVCNSFGEEANSDSGVKECKVLFDVPADIQGKVTCLIKCYDCKPVTPAVPSKCSGSLGRDLMALLTSGKDSDMTINVKDREFKVHKNIMGARSPVFCLMLKNDMIEKKTGNFDIPDCDPEIFQKFLEYVYSGILKELSNNIVCSLYNITQKYQVLELKEECIEFMLKNLSLENFCDVAALSVVHNELELLDAAENFFVENSKAIVETDGWLDCMRQTPVVANYFVKLLLRPEDYRKKKRKQWNRKERKKSQAICKS